MKTIFFGSSSYCLPIVRVLKEKFDLIAIITKPGSILEKENVPHIFSPKTKEELLNLKTEIGNLKPDLAVVADFGFIIPKDIFEIPKYKTINIHFSKLPKLRGASPVQYTILFGEKNAWVSIILMDEKMDRGGILWQKEYSRTNNGTTKDLYEKLFDLVSLDLPDVINEFVQNRIKPVKQDESKATYTKQLTRGDGYIPFEILQSILKGEEISEEKLITWPLYKIFLNCPLSLPRRQAGIVNYPLSIHNACLALSPWPGLWTEIQITDNSKQLTKKRLKILLTHLEENKLVIDQVQLEGKNPVSFKQFQEAYKVF